jgi:hypothetical protein
MESIWNKPYDRIEIYENKFLGIWWKVTTIFSGLEKDKDKLYHDTKNHYDRVYEDRRRYMIKLLWQSETFCNNKRV